MGLFNAINTNETKYKAGDITTFAEAFGYGEKEPWYKSMWLYIYWGVERNYRDAKFWLRKGYQRVKYGFPLIEVWNFNSFLAEWALPRLKHLRTSKNGYPCEVTSGNDENQLCFDFYKKSEQEVEDEAKAKWGIILDKIIWSFENLDNWPEPIKPPNYDERYRVEERGGIEGNGGLEFVSIDDRKWDWAPVNKHQEKIQEGLDLFAKHYQNLWD